MPKSLSTARAKRNTLFKTLCQSQADWNEVFEKTGRNTVPQVFIKGVYIGGSDDLYEADQTGKLDEILNG